MFDLSNGVVRPKLLTDKAQGDVHKEQPDFVKKAFNILGSQVTSIWKSAGRKFGEKPMQMLIAQELANTIELKEKPPSVVAKLMGLNSLPVQQRVSQSKKNLPDTNLHRLSIRALDRQQQESHSSKMSFDGGSHVREKIYKDVYEVKQKLSSGIQFEKENPHPEDHHRSLAEKRMAVVHQKFTETKRLTTNEKVLRSKELKDALEVLSSNRDLFLKLLEEPNSLFSSQFNELNQTNSLGNHIKCITVLKPTTSADIDHDKSASKNQHAFDEEITGFDGHDQSSSLFIPKAEAVSQSCRIVVLKASTEMLPGSRYINGDLEVDEDARSREVAKGIAFRTQKDLSSTQKDVYPRASALSSGYVTDENSPDVSETSIHFESSVSREAKKRLSERLESVISNGVDPEQGNVRKKSSNTLGEMLAISEVKKEEEEEAAELWVSYGEEQHTGMTRSKSLPASSCCENIREKEELSPAPSIKSTQAPKIKNVKASFKEKVSGLFFSRMKTVVRDKPRLSGSVSSDGRLHENSSSAIKDDNVVEDYRISCENSLKTVGGTEFRFLSPISVSGAEKHGNVSLKGIRSIEKPWKSEVPREYCNQPSSISALERPSQDDDPLGSIPRSSHSAVISNPQALSRSPLISSVSRSSNWETLHPDSVPMTSFKLFRLFFKEDEEKERLDFITKLLSFSNLADEKSAALLEKSHSLDSPLNPVLLDELLEQKGEEGKCRERRSNQMLYFDSVNIALKGICQCLLADAYPWPTTVRRSRKRVESTLSVRDAVWFRIKDCFSEDGSCASAKAENSKKYVNHLVMREAAGGGLVESMWLEMDEVGKEICEEMLEELFDDTLADLTGCWL